MNLGKIDKSNMHDVILDFPNQFRAGIESAKHIFLDSQFKILNSVLIAGMGGSALPGELLKLFSVHLRWGLRVNIHRNYGLPNYAESRILTLCISYSGNTEEAISAYREAKKADLPLIAITTGGELARLAKKDRVPVALIPDTGIQPRAATGNLFAATLKVLSNARILPPQDKELLTLEKTLRPKSLENRGIALAKKIKGKIPLIYTSQNYKALAYMWKIKFNETSKSHAFSNYFPELNHNEMVGYHWNHGSGMKDQEFYPIILKFPDDHARIKKRMQLLEDIIQKRGYSVGTIDIKGESLYNRVFNAITLADWASYYLALEYGVDPTPVGIVEEFKKLLK